MDKNRLLAKKPVASHDCKCFEQEKRETLLKNYAILLYTNLPRRTRGPLDAPPPTPAPPRRLPYSRRLNEHKINTT